MELSLISLQSTSTHMDWDKYTCIKQGLKWVSQLINQDRREWRRTDLVLDLFRPHDADQILKLKIPSEPSDDFLARHYEKHMGYIYSVRSAHRPALALQQQEEQGARQPSSSLQGSRPGWKMFWRIQPSFNRVIYKRTECNRAARSWACTAGEKDKAFNHLVF